MKVARTLMVVAVATAGLAMLTMFGGILLDVEAAETAAIVLLITTACLFVSAAVSGIRLAIHGMSGEQKDEALDALEQPQNVVAEVLGYSARAPARETDRGAARARHAARAGVHRIAVVVQVVSCVAAVVGLPIGIGVWWHADRDIAIMFFAAWALVVFLIVAELVSRARLRRELAQIASGFGGKRVVGRDATSAELDWLDAHGWGGAPFVTDVHSGGFRYVVTGTVGGAPAMLSVAHRSLLSFSRGSLRTGSDLVAAYVSFAGGAAPQQLSQLAVAEPFQLTSSPGGLQLCAPTRRVRDVRALQSMLL